MALPRHPSIDRGIDPVKFESEGARSLLCEFQRARAEALADRLGIPGEITILSLKRLAASASTNSR